MRLVDLSHPLRDGQAAFPGDPPLHVVSHCKLDSAEGYNLSRISMGSHHGTHLDAMRHFLAQGKSIDQMPLQWFYGPAHVLRIPRGAGQEIDVAQLRPYESIFQNGARVIIETGWHAHYGRPDFYEAFPVLSLEAARFAANSGIRLLGMDTPSPSHDGSEIHNLLLGQEIVIVESLAHLDKVPDSFVFTGFPLNWVGGDGSPIRAVALVE
jgi:kynurenine formamidase